MLYSGMYLAGASFPTRPARGTAGAPTAARGRCRARVLTTTLRSGSYEPISGTAAFGECDINAPKGSINGGYNG